MREPVTSNVDLRTPDAPAPPPHPLRPAALLDLLSAATGGASLPALPSDSYARDHAEFEARSSQRGLITAYLLGQLAHLGDGPLSVLSVGCGDGSVDVALADALTADLPHRPVRYVGVDPFPASVTQFERRLSDLDRPSLEVHGLVATFDDADLVGRFDVITFVHSMYYVPGVAATLQAAYDLLAPGGVLLVLSAPRGDLNRLAGVLAPPLEGHRQWFSDDVSAGLEEAGLHAVETEALVASVDLTDASDDVLEFTVQARLTEDLTSLVRAYLRAVAVPGPALVLRHPVDAYRVAWAGSPAA